MLRTIWIALIFGNLSLVSIGLLQADEINLCWVRGENLIADNLLLPTRTCIKSITVAANGFGYLNRPIVKETRIDGFSELPDGSRQPILVGLDVGSESGEEREHLYRYINVNVLINPLGSHGTQILSYTFYVPLEYNGKVLKQAGRAWVTPKSVRVREFLSPAFDSNGNFTHPEVERDPPQPSREILMSAAALE